MKTPAPTKLPACGLLFSRRTIHSHGVAAGENACTCTIMSLKRLSTAYSRKPTLGWLGKKNGHWVGRAIRIAITVLIDGKLQGQACLQDLIPRGCTRVGAQGLPRGESRELLEMHVPILVTYMWDGIRMA
jgi:hypothetical protein